MASDNPFGLQIATAAEAEALRAFACSIMAEDAAQPISEAKVGALVDRCIARDRALAGVVLGPDGEIEASVGATLDEFIYTDETHLMVQWLGVAPAHRKTDRAARLLSYVNWLHERMAALSDAPVPVFLSTLCLTDNQRKMRLIHRRLPLVGSLFALGCLPDRSFFDPAHAGRKEGLPGSTKGVPLVRSASTIAATG